jgi:hypothetical protein
MQPKLSNPNQSAILTLTTLSGFTLLVALLLGALAIQGYFNFALLAVSLVFLIVLSLMSLIIWLLGARQVWRARSFLKSDRPLVRWTYSPSEWQAIKEAAWQESKGDWMIQGGCLTLVLALAGLLTGIMLALDLNLPEGVAIALTGLMIGGLAGVLTGALVAGGNYLGARQAYRRQEPGIVALGPDELLASDNYFQGDGTNGYILEATLHTGRPATLECVLVVPPRPRMPRQALWRISVPDRFVEIVEANLPRLAPHGQKITSKWGHSRLSVAAHVQTYLEQQPESSKL